MVDYLLFVIRMNLSECGSLDGLVFRIMNQNVFKFSMQKRNHRLLFIWTKRWAIDDEFYDQTKITNMVILNCQDEFVHYINVLPLQIVRMESFWTFLYVDLCVCVFRRRKLPMDMYSEKKTKPLRNQTIQRFTHWSLENWLSYDCVAVFVHESPI